MSEEQQQEEAAPEVIVDYSGECPSITGRSVLTYEVGHDAEGQQLFRIADNSGKGMWFAGWAPVSAIEEILKTNELSARSFNAIHPGKSINTGGFILAVMKDLGVIKPKEDSRQHEPVMSTSLTDALAERIAAQKKPGRKAKAE